MMSESMVEIQVLFFASSAAHVWVYYSTHASLVVYADAVVVSQRAIEGDTRLGARADIAHEHVVKEEG